MYKISYKTELHVGKGALQQLSHYKNEHIFSRCRSFFEDIWHVGCYFSQL